MQISIDAFEIAAIITTSTPARARRLSKMSDPKEKTFITAKQVSGMMTIPLPTIYGRVARRDGFPQPYKFGRRNFRWDLAEIEQFIEQSRQPETAEV
jgi:predicted DNA-binding transcriptional regulator AlpA